MGKLSDEGRRALGDIASRHGTSADAVEHVLMALVAGQGTQAQFNHPDLGGMGQWSQGGMTMVGDMFNNALKAKVDAICSDLAALLRGSDLFLRPASHQSQSQGQAYGQAQSQGHGSGVSLFVPGAFSAANWWPGELGYPSSTGAQNSLRYAFFPEARRLAIDLGGRVVVYDTRDHFIGGFSQQQGGDQSLSFTSQYGLVRVSELDEVPLSGASSIAKTGDAAAEWIAEPQSTVPADQPVFAPAPQAPPPPASHPAQAHAEVRHAPAAEDDIFDKIERLAALHAKGILTDKEFEAKKADLLDRL